jgi:hypothetical protein
MEWEKVEEITKFQHHRAESDRRWAQDAGWLRTKTPNTPPVKTPKRHRRVERRKALALDRDFSRLGTTSDRALARAAES